MTTEAHRPRMTVRTGLPGWGDGASAPRHLMVAVGLALVVSLVLLGISVLGIGLMAHASSNALFGSSPSQAGKGSAASAADPQSLTLERTVVEERRAAVATFGGSLAEFKVASARAPGAVGINLAAAEAKRREAALNELVLECINAVDRYNLEAQAFTGPRLQSLGLPERYTWTTDCAGQ